MLSATIVLLGLAARSALSVEVDAKTFANTTYDFVVVGGGTTGLALAARLSENSDIKVGVIDAGSYVETPNITIPGLIGTTVGDPRYDWMLSTTPQQNLGGRQIGLGRGKVLGGTSALNYLAYTKPSTRELDDWDDKLGNNGWGFDSLQTYMKRSEKWTAPDPTVANTYFASSDSSNHGTNGSILTGAYAFYSSVVLPFFQTLNGLNVPTNTAPNGGKNTGVYSVTGTINVTSAARSYAATAYYKQYESRSNYQVLFNAQATKIVFGKSYKGKYPATGVEFVTNDGQTYTVNAKREVTLSAGSIKTPQLLELSGVGNDSILKPLGINTLIKLPGVGENLHEHPGVFTNFQTLDNETTLDALSDPTFAQQQLTQYTQNATGEFSSTPSTLAFLALKDFVSQDILTSLKSQLDTATQMDTKYKSNTYKTLRSWMDQDDVAHLEMVLFPALAASATPPAQGKRYYSILCLLQHGWARGSTHITSKNATTPPATDLQYLNAPADIDMKILVQALKYAWKIGTTGPLSQITTSTLAPTLGATDEQLTQFIKDHLTTNYHYSGSTAMLPWNQNGVVDSNLLVYGTSNVRIADAGIIPLLFAGHPQSVLYGIGEKAADIIKSSNKLS